MFGSLLLIPILFVIGLVFALVMHGLTGRVKRASPESSGNGTGGTAIAEVSLPYSRRASLFTAAERNFLGCLEAALDADKRVFGKVRIEDLIAVKGASGKEWAAARGRIKSRHVDFVVCDANSMEILAAIELDDSSHGSAKAMKVDAFKDSCFNAAGLPLIRFNASYGYSVADLRQMLPASLWSQGKSAGLAVSGSENDLRLQFQGSEIPTALACDEEFLRLSEPSGDADSVVLRGAPSPQLKGALKREGYTAQRVHGTWVWSRKPVDLN